MLKFTLAKNVRFAPALALLLPFSLLAQGNSNGWQVLQPGRTNFVARQASFPASSSLVFKSDLFDGNTTPEIGELAAAYARTGAMYYADTNSSLGEVAANTAPVPAFRYGGTETSGGLRVAGGMTNFAKRSEHFDNAVWLNTGTGTPTQTADQAVARDGNTTADLLSGSGLDATSGIEQAAIGGFSGAASNRWYGAVDLKTVSGTGNVILQIQDAGATEKGETICPVTTSWSRCEVAKQFTASASGASTLRILHGTVDVHAWGADHHRFNYTPSDTNRGRGAKPYIESVDSINATGAYTYAVDNAMLTDMTTSGSVCLWAMPFFDGPSLTLGAGAYLFGTSGQDLDMFVDYAGGWNVKINNTTVVSSVADSNEWAGIEKYTWNHWCLTYDTAANETKVYRDGSLVITSADAISTIDFGVSDLGIGYQATAGSGVYFDGLIAQFAVWNSVIDAATVTEVYDLKSADFAPAAYGTGKLFEVSLGTSLIPTTGNTKYWYHMGANNFQYYDSSTSLDTAANGEAPRPAFGLNDSSGADGMMFGGNNVNLILQSEAPATSPWADIGTATVMDSVGTFLGSISYGTILGISGDGIEQVLDGPVAAASEAAVCSVYASVSAGTLDFDIIIQGSSGGTPETTTCDHTATTTVDRYDCYGTFTASATGNIEVQYLINASGTLRLGGMHCEPAHPGTQTQENRAYQQVTNQYCKTTTAACSGFQPLLVYESKDNINPEVGTVIAWVQPFLSTADFVTPRGPTILGASAAPSETLYLHMLSDGLSMKYASDNIMSGNSATFTAGTWTQIAYTWDNTAGTPAFEMMQNGVSIETATFTTDGQIPALDISIGQDQRRDTSGDYYFNNTYLLDSFYGLIDKITIYGSKKTAAEVLTEFDAEKAGYGL